MPKCEISERTLELNVCCSIIEDLRRRGWPKAYVEGYVLRHEGIYGLDVSIKVPPSTRLLSLQFKKPVKCLDCCKRYVFPINNNRWHDQHLLLLLLSLALKRLSKKPLICYALPKICSLEQLGQILPNLLRETYFVNVLDVPFVGFRSCELLIVEDLNPRVFFRCSRSREITFFYTWEKLLEELRETFVSAADLMKVTEIEYEQLERDLVSHLSEYNVPGIEIELVIEHLRRKRMKQPITAIALGIP